MKYTQKEIAVLEQALQYMKDKRKDGLCSGILEQCSSAVAHDLIVKITSDWIEYTKNSKCNFVGFDHVTGKPKHCYKAISHQNAFFYPYKDIKIRNKFINHLKTLK